MVDRVGNGPGYGYTQVNEKKVNTNAAGAGEKFQLNYGKEGAIYEPSSEALKRQQTEKGSASKNDTAAKAEENGVRLTLTGTTTETAKKAENEGNVTSGGILDTVTSIVNKLIDAIKGFISSIWNEEPKVENTAASEDVDLQKTSDAAIERTTDTDKIEEEKPKTQFEKAKAEAEAFLASAEGKKVARNSDLLTYYDKHGSVISVSPSDRQRILYGDKNQIEV